MTETINSANAAASTLFLGHNGEWWDFWLIVSVVFAALAAIAIGITTTGSIVSHKREASAAEVLVSNVSITLLTDDGRQFRPQHNIREPPQARWHVYHR